MSDYQRHGELIDKKFLTSLTPAESQELAQIQRRLDDVEGDFYRSAREHQLKMLGSWSRETAAKAITLWQPWATLVAIGAKQFETRSWTTRHRGPLVIHAAKRFKRPEIELCYAAPFRAVLAKAGYPSPESLPLGRALCVVELRFIYPTERLKQQNEQEAAFGNYEAGRFAWSLKILQMFKPIPMQGRQGIWTLTPDERSSVEAAIAVSKGGRK